MAEDPREGSICLGCGGPASFTLTLIFYRLRFTPKVQTNSQAYGVCLDCCKPIPGDTLNQQRREKLMRSIGTIIWTGHNGLEAKAREVGASAVSESKPAPAAAPPPAAASPAVPPAAAPAVSSAPVPLDRKSAGAGEGHE